MKKLSLIAMVFSFLLTGCATQAATVPDISAVNITLPTVHSGEVAAYNRVVALANGSAEIIAALGYVSILVGRDVASTMPELSAVTIDNPGHNVSAETILTQKPDLIIIDKNTSPTTALNTLKASGIKVVQTESPFDVASIALKESEIGRLLNVPKATSLLQADLNSITYTKSMKKVIFLYLRGTASIYLIGGKGSGADSLIASIGYQNPGTTSKFTKLPFNALSAEALVSLNPDVILVMTKGLASVGGVEGLVALPGIAQTSAGKNRRVVSVDDSLLLSFGPRTVPMLKALRTNIERVLK